MVNMSDKHYTPKSVYDVVKDWAVNQYHLQGKNIVRPFWPGADYKTYDYQPNDVVIDNPPFSIQQQIVDWYLERKIPFFLFVDGKSLSLLARDRPVTYVIVNQKIRYDNSGMRVKTNFLTNLEPENMAHTVPTLDKAISKVDNPYKQKGIAKYVYPQNLLRFTELDRIAVNGYEYVVSRSKSKFVRGLDEQKPFHKEIFGGGVLVNDSIKPTPEMTQQADFVWHLSEDEKRFTHEMKGE